MQVESNGSVIDVVVNVTGRGFFQTDVGPDNYDQCLYALLPHICTYYICACVLICIDLLSLNTFSYIYFTFIL